MPLEEFHYLPGIPTCSFQSGYWIQKVSKCQAAERTRPNFVRLPQSEECLGMDRTEILFGPFAGFAAYGTIHEENVSSLTVGYISTPSSNRATPNRISMRGSSVRLGESLRPQFKKYALSKRHVERQDEDEPIYTEPSS